MDEGNIVLHAILMCKVEVVLNTAMLEGRQHCLYNKVGRAELCGMEKELAVVLYTTEKGRSDEG